MTRPRRAAETVTHPTPPCAPDPVVEAACAEVETRFWPLPALLRWLCPVCGDVHVKPVARRLIGSYRAMEARVYRSRTVEDRRARRGGAR